MQLEMMASLGTLIASVTDEINKPLQRLHTIFQATEGDEAEASQNADWLVQAGEQIERIDTIVHNMGLYIQSGAEQQPTQTSNINVTAAQVLELLADKFTAAGIRVETEIAEDLPLVACSAEGLMHVLVHLLLNAYETLQDYPQPYMTVTIAPLETEQLVVSVCDNNIEAENLCTLMLDPLFSTKLPEVSGGLGLALACHFVEGSGGYISIDSTVGHGCCIKAVFNTIAPVS
jgi:phosphoglycerate-specific signal transduction histidine kinase